MAGRVDRIAAHVTAAPLVGVSASLAPNPVLGGKITLAEVESTIKAWAQAANERDIEKTVAMYDPEIGRLLGTVDEAASPRRTSLALIKDYFSHFLGDNSAVSRTSRPSTLRMSSFSRRIPWRTPGTTCSP